MAIRETKKKKKINNFLSISPLFQEALSTNFPDFFNFLKGFFFNGVSFTYLRKKKSKGKTGGERRK